MSTSDNPAFLVTVTAATALPSAYSFEETRPISEQFYPFPSVQPIALDKTPHSRARGRRSISMQEWEDVKPLIRRVYLDENKPFNYLARILRTEHGFEPTKRQFSRKVDEWGFRKNLSQSERRRILRSLDREVEQQISTINDRRLGPGKLGNWRRRYRKEANAIGLLRTQPLSLARASASQDFKVKTRTQGEMTPISAVQSLSEAPPIIEQSDKSSGMENLNTSALNPGSMDCDIWPFSWSAVNVPGSPGLSRLFCALEIECSTPVTPLSLDEQIPEESQCISGTEMLDLWKEENRSLVYELDVSHSPAQEGLIPATLKGQTRVLPWRDPNLAFCGWNGSPFNEIYVFPTSPTKALYQPASSRKPLCARLKAQAAELRIKLSKLKPLLGVEDPRIIAIMQGLADIYIDQGSYHRAERLHRYVANVTQKSSGPTNLKTIAAWQKWVRCLLYQGRYLHAEAVLSKMHSTILKLVNPSHNIATDATFLMAWTAMNLDDDEKAEELLRQVLQIRLNTLGPRSHGTWISMDYLGYLLNKQLKCSEAEKLLRTVVQLRHEFAELEREMDLCDAMNDLSSTLIKQELYKESEDIARHAVERFEMSLGPEHPIILKTHVQLARSIAAQGQYQESEDMLRTVLKQQSIILGESHPYTLSTNWGLAMLFEEMDYLEEATILYEKSFWGDLDLYEPDGRNTISSCDYLGWCYEKQGRYDDAMKLYRQLVERIQAVKGNDHPAIAKIQGWMESVQNQLLEEEDMSGEETNTLSEGGEEDVSEEETDNLSEEVMKM